MGLDFLRRLLLTIPPRRMNMVRFHGVFAPNSKHRALITPAGRGKGRKKAGQGGDDLSFAERHGAMTWAQRLKRVFNIDVSVCSKCGGEARVVATQILPFERAWRDLRL